MRKKNKEYDENIIKALKALPVPLVTAKGNRVLFDVDKRDETIFEHIANKKHHLHVKDIMVIPSILLDKNSVQKDSKSHSHHNYIGRRGKKGEKNKYLKIITENKNKNDETVITIYSIRKIIDK